MTQQSIPIETITPEMAKAYLAHNKNNRPIRMKYAEAIARDIKDGNWWITHQGIAFDVDGNILDGQHRLMACVLANKPITVPVTRGMSRSAMEAVDIGIKRNFVDVAVISGKYADEPTLRSTSTISMVRKLINLGYNSNIRVTDHEIDKIICAFHDEVIEVALAAGKKGNVYAAVSAAALAAVIWGEPTEDIRKFFDVFARGDASRCFGCNISAAFNLSRIVLDAKAKGVSINNPRLFSLAQNAIYLFLRGKTAVTIIRETKNDRYPVADKIKKVLEG